MQSAVNVMDTDRAIVPKPHKLEYVKQPPSSLATVCLERKEPSNQQEYNRDDRKDACGGRSDFRRHCGDLCGKHMRTRPTTSESHLITVTSTGQPPVHLLWK
jgi:hypothetical protein